MCEITYSQGLIIEDPLLLSTFAVFGKKIWLPEAQVRRGNCHIISSDADAIV